MHLSLSEALETVVVDPDISGAVRRLARIYFVVIESPHQVSQCERGKVASLLA